MSVFAFFYTILQSMRTVLLSVTKGAHMSVLSDVIVLVCSQPCLSLHTMLRATKDAPSALSIVFLLLKYLLQVIEVA